MKISMAVIVISTLLEHNRANAAVTAGSLGAIATLSGFADQINPILQMLGYLVTIIVASTTTYIAIQNHKERNKDK